MRNLILYFGCLFFLLFHSCRYASHKKEGKLYVVCTTGMLGDGLQNICGNSCTVEALMGAGVDPHLYKPTLRDLDKLSEADVIVYSGLHLEGKMIDIFEKLSKKKKVISASDGLSEDDILTTADKGGAHDPHIWMDAKIWGKAMKYVSTQLALADSVNREIYSKNSIQYLARIDSADQVVRDLIAEIPEKNRVLITSHDAFQYFGRAYGVEVRGLQGISTMAEFGLNDITHTVDFICERKLPCVFVESSVSEKSMRAVTEGCQSRGCSVKTGESLYSDAMGTSGTFEGTYIGMIISNAQKMKRGLSSYK